MNEERKEELRRLADKLGYFGIESQASDAIKELLKEVDRLDIVLTRQRDYWFNEYKKAEAESAQSIEQAEQERNDYRDYRFNDEWE